MRIVEMLDAGRGLEAARAHEGALRRIERERLVAAALERERQAAIDMAGRQPRHEIGEAAERARREPGQHVIFGVPARPAIALGEEGALAAVEGFEMGAI